MAEGGDCSSDCRSWFGCGGTIEATSTSLVRVNSNLDYALLKLPNNVSNQYGFLQLREEGATQGERIYIPQHPQAWGKRIAVESTDSHDAGGFARVHSLYEPRCGGSGYDVGYYADTKGGSSGSPVLGHSDNLVIALHHCGSCPNRGVPIQEIISDLGNDIPNNSIGYGTTIADITTLCYANSKTINLNNNQSNSTNWQVSSNVTILSNDNSSITIRASSSNSTGNGWVRAILSNGITLQEDFKVGVPDRNKITIEHTTNTNGDYILINNIWSILTSYHQVNNNFIGAEWDWKFEPVGSNMSILTRNDIGNRIDVSVSGEGQLIVKTRVYNECGCSLWKDAAFQVKKSSTNPGGLFDGILNKGF